MTKAFVIDIDRCNGCHNCQIVCKDEHCEQAWLPYAQAQPLIGQFWMNVEEKTRGSVPLVKVSYIPKLSAHSQKMVDFAPDCVYKREDGLTIIDPEKAKGRKDIAEAFPDEVYWNEELQIPQKCTGCAHLLDNGWEIPRCVDACATGALRYIDTDEVDLSEATQLEEGSLVYYLNYPKRFIGGTVVDLEADEVIIGAKVKLKGIDDTIFAETQTDEFGDFIFEQIEGRPYEIVIAKDGYEIKTVAANAVEADISLGDIALTVA